MECIFHNGTWDMLRYIIVALPRPSIIGLLDCVVMCMTSMLVIIFNCKIFKQDHRYHNRRKAF